MTTTQRQKDIDDLISRFDPDNPFVERTPDDLLRERDRVVMKMRYTGRCILACVLTSAVAWCLGVWFAIELTGGWQ